MMMMMLYCSMNGYANDTRKKTKNERKTPAYPCIHGTGNVDAEYQNGVLVSLATGSLRNWSRTDHVCHVRLTGNLLSEDIDRVFRATEFTLPRLNDINNNILHTQEKQKKRKKWGKNESVLAPLNQEAQMVSRES